MKTTTTIFMKNLKLLTTTLFLLFLQYSYLYAQIPHTPKDSWTSIVSSTCPNWTSVLTGTATNQVSVNSDNAVVEGSFANAYSDGTGVDAYITTHFHASNYTVQLRLSDGSLTPGVSYSTTDNISVGSVNVAYTQCTGTANGTYNTTLYYVPIDFASFTIGANLAVTGSLVTLNPTKGAADIGKFVITTNASLVTLPVDLIAFTAEPLGNKDALLHWTTASEINNSHFDVERSYDGRTFEAVGNVAGNGNSQHQIEYSYTDAFVSKVQNTVYYRLKQVDFDGAYEYSDIRVVRFDAVGNDMQLVAYPNPMNDELNVMLSLPSGEKYQLQVTNPQGALVHQKNHVFSSGLHTLDLSQWNSGVYIVEVISDRGSEHIKVMKK